jgi:hypothetical protein
MCAPILRMTLCWATSQHIPGSYSIIHTLTYPHIRTHSLSKWTAPSGPLPDLSAFFPYTELSLMDGSWFRRCVISCSILDKCGRRFIDRVEIRSRADDFVERTYRREWMKSNYTTRVICKGHYVKFQWLSWVELYSHLSYILTIA